MWTGMVRVKVRVDVGDRTLIPTLTLFSTARHSTTKEETRTTSQESSGEQHDHHCCHWDSRNMIVVDQVRYTQCIIDV